MTWSICSHLLVGFIILVVASAMMRASPGHMLEHTIHACDGAGCHVDASGPNQSSLAHGNVVCQCCWRECDLDNEHVPVGLKEDQPKSDPLRAADIDAWLIMCHHKQPIWWNIYTPILETVKVGVESQGAVAQIIGRDRIDSMVQEVKAAVAQGRRPLVFAVALQFSVDQKEHLVSKFMEARLAGAYIVYYQTESLFSSTSIHYGQIHAAHDLAMKMGAHEIWDYSLAHTSNYGARFSDFIVRYVPSGYVPRLDAGVDVNSNLTDPTTIGYIGRTKKEMHWKYEEMLGDHLNADNNIFDNIALRKYLERFPMQLNQHHAQSCCPRDTAWESEHQHFESFRMSILLANKACVISAPSADADMDVWKSVVHFVEVEDTVPMMKHLGGKLMECRLQSYETYKREFAPLKLLQRSGFFQAWWPPHGKP